jgi:L-threonylcarbamoyladenylate synthase
VTEGTEGPDELAAAVDALRAGEVVGIPTDTVYGLAVDPTRRGATEALFALKGRPSESAVAVLVSDVAQAELLAGPHGLPEPARRLAACFWPGALTVVVGRRPDLDWELGGRPSTIGLRCPASLVARRLCRKVGPLATTSANPHGRSPMTTAAELSATFGDGLVVVDGGRCDAPPSTVADLTASPHCVRTGAVSWEEVESVLRRA